MVAPAGHVDAGIVVASWRLPVLFSLTLFGSAALLFVVEPMFARMVLPRLGGSPAVWNTCVMFFQAAMLGGYAYAHLSTRWLTLWQQVALHAALVLTVDLAAAAGAGYSGFAVGRSIWADAVLAHDRGDLDAATARADIAARYGAFIDTFQRAG